MKEQWLVRTAENVIAGPFSKDQIVDLIREQGLTDRDEICQANDYWFFLSERELVLDRLGIEPPAPSRNLQDPDEEETQTEASRAKITQKVPMPSEADEDTPTPQDMDRIRDQPEIPELPDLSEFDDDDAALVLRRNRALRQFQAKSALAHRLHEPEWAGTSLSSTQKLRILWIILVVVFFGMITALIYFWPGPSSRF